jgi:hypothetical protein
MSHRENMQKKIVKGSLQTQCRVTMRLFKMCIHLNWRSVKFELFLKHLFKTCGAAKAREDNWPQSANMSSRCASCHGAAYFRHGVQFSSANQ